MKLHWVVIENISIVAAVTCIAIFCDSWWKLLCLVPLVNITTYGKNSNSEE